MSTTAKSSSPSVTGSAAAADMTRRMICGGVAGMVAKTATNPLERIKMLSQTGEGRSTGIFKLYRNILQAEGILGLWAGNGVNLLRVFPAKAVVFSSNDLYQRFWKRVLGTERLSGGMAFLSGGMAGMTATAVTYPLDFARGRISGKLACPTTGHKQYKGIVHTLSLTMREEGVWALYQGVRPTLLGAMPYEGIKFGTVGLLEKLFPSTEESNKPLRKMLYGGCGGVMAGLITYPNDTVRRLLQLQGSRGTTEQYDGYWDCVRKTYRKEGFVRFYRGLTINVIRMAPNAAVQFGSYELLKQWTAGYF